MVWPQVLIFARLKKTWLLVGINCKEEALNLSTSNWTSGMNSKQVLGQDSEALLWCYKWLKATLTAPSWVGKNRLGPRTAPASPVGFPVSDASSPWPGQPVGLEQGFSAFLNLQPGLVESHCPMESALSSCLASQWILTSKGRVAGNEMDTPGGWLKQSNKQNHTSRNVPPNWDGVLEVGVMGSAQPLCSPQTEMVCWRLGSWTQLSLCALVVLAAGPWPPFTWPGITSMTFKLCKTWRTASCILHTVSKI